jgi:hypothetical protein
VGGEAISDHESETGIICNTEFCAEGSLDSVGPGYWLIMADIEMRCQAGGEDDCHDQHPIVKCRLMADESVLAETSFITHDSKGIFNFPLSMHRTTQFLGEKLVQLRCQDRGDEDFWPDYEGQNMSLTAMRLGSMG